MKNYAFFVKSTTKTKTVKIHAHFNWQHVFLEIHEPAEKVSPRKSVYN